jgi:hypothetical protein
LYFYVIKIQINIKQNLVKKYAGKSQNFLKIYIYFYFFWTGPDPAHSFWVGPDLPGLVNTGALSTVHMQREQWRREPKKTKWRRKKKKEEGRTCGAAGGC